MKRIAHSTALLTPTLAVRSKIHILSSKSRKRLQEEMETEGVLGRGPKEEKSYILPDRLLKVLEELLPSIVLLNRFLGKSA